jgi:hypothetical protein
MLLSVIPGLESRLLFLCKFELGVVQDPCVSSSDRAYDMKRSPKQIKQEDRRSPNLDQPPDAAGLRFGLGANLVILLQSAEIGRDVLPRPFERDSSVREHCPEQGPVVVVRHCKQVH